TPANTITAGSRDLLRFNTRVRILTAMKLTPITAPEGISASHQDADPPDTEAQAERQVRAWFPSLRPIRQADRLVFTFFREFNRFQNRGTSSWCRVLDDKLLFSGFLASIGISTPATHWVVSRGHATSASGERVPIEELAQRLQAGRWFVKPRANEGGKGACLLQDGTVTTAGGQSDAGDAATLQLLDAGEDLLVQDAVVQTPEYAFFAPSSLNTVRCLTYLTRAGSAEVVAAVMRMGNGRSVVDNTASGGIYCAIGHETRCLVGPGYDKSGTAFDQHPTSGMVLQGTPVARLDGVFATCTLAHGILGGPVAIGGDVSMTEQGPCIIEANTMWAASGPRADASARKRLWTCFLQDRYLSGAGFPDDLPRMGKRDFVTAHFRVRGQVQRVGYRRWITRLARDKGLDHTVTNWSNGDVDVTLSGPLRTVEFAVMLARRGPDSADIAEL